MNRGEAIYARTGMGGDDIYGRTGRPNVRGGGGDDLDDFSDDETPMTEPIYNGSQRSYIDTKGWDVFRTLPPEAATRSEATNSKMYFFSIKLLKIVVILLSFVCVLFGTVGAKVAMFLMTSQIRPHKTTAFCNVEIDRSRTYIAEIAGAEQVVWVWVLFISFCIPEVFTFLRSMRMVCFKSPARATAMDTLVVIAMESMSMVGLGLLAFYVWPNLDVIKGAMLTNCVAFAPGVFGLLSRHSRESHRALKMIFDLGAILMQATGFVIWPLVESWQGNSVVWAIPVSILLTSISWWENYVDRRSPIQFVKKLGKVKERLKKSRYYVYALVAPIKVAVFFVTMLFSLWLNGQKVSMIFTEAKSGFVSHGVNITQVEHGGDVRTDQHFLRETIEVRSESAVPIYTAVVLGVGVYLAYIFGKFACKICVQGLSFAFPLMLSVPVTVITLITMCGLRTDDPCWMKGYLPDYLYFECPASKNDFLVDFISNQHAWAWMLWLLSQCWITFHIWVPHCERLAPTEKLFVTPWYCSLLPDQSLALNRRRDDEGEVKTEDLLDRQALDENDLSQYYETISIHTESSNTNATKQRTSDSITKIYACATMWHETRSEMMDMLKSIYRMDEDQSARRVAQKYLKVVDNDYYEYETHIFFDDAFEVSDVCDDWMQVNNFVKDFISCVDEAASHIHGVNIRVRAPKKVPTPYGGRLVYTLPGKTKMHVHLKDKSRIRHKKRWSQCMYMYYLLGHRLMELPIAVERKAVMAENCFLLTLDGDIDFQPNAVSLLVDLMKKNKNLGAACGRIHPVGTGPMVWYQLFEYAIGHWLQKATEHMIGCVMCSPGCFSLFRAKALMDDNVMRRYTTKSEEPIHYVQYDQGEDRWLCTLLLQRGYRVEYSAASDAYTHCPESFNEFFTQRRRWVPSTIANIFDLVREYKKTVRVNDNISMPYIGYQVMLLVGTIIGPGTIFLMLVGAFVAAFKISNWVAFGYNLIPILVYMFVCLNMPSKYQLALSALLSTGYAMVMMAVIVGTALQLGEDGIASPSAVFLISMTGSFFIAACLHPQEFWCIVPGIIYLLCIPAMYLLLIIYSITNLNVVSWGTREVAVKKTKKEMEAERKAAATNLKSAKKTGGTAGIWAFLQKQQEEVEGHINFNIGDLLQIKLFNREKNNATEMLAFNEISDKLETVLKRLEAVEGFGDQGTKKHRRKSSRLSAHGEIIHGLSDDIDDDIASQATSSKMTEQHEERDQLVNPYWLEERPVFSRGEVDYLSGSEIAFWADLIEKYLYPLDADKAKQDAIAAGLRELRNKMVFFFSVFNALFVLIVFMLTLHKDTLHIDWPFGVKENITYTEDEQVIITKEYLHLEPIGIILVFFFFAIILIQFIAMLFHRFGTISHIMASTDLSCFHKKEEILSDEALIEKNAVEIVKQMQKLRGFDGDNESDSQNSNRLAGRRTIYNLEKSKTRKKQIGTLDVAFKKRFFALNGGDEIAADGSKAPQTPILGGAKVPMMRRSTIKALETRRDEVITERKQQSKMRTLGASNPHNNNKDKHRNTTRITGDSVAGIFANGGVDNTGFDAGPSNTDEDSVHGAGVGRPGIKFRDPKAAAALQDRLAAGSSSDQHSTSATSKM